MKRVYILSKINGKQYVSLIVDRKILFNHSEDRAMMFNGEDALRLLEYLSKYYDFVDTEDVYKFKTELIGNGYKNYVKRII